MKRYLYSVLCIVTMFLGCTACDPKPEPTDPCDSFDCGSGTCIASGNTASCDCSDNLYGEHCELYFNPGDFLVNETFCAADSGRVEITGQTGQYANYNGYYVDIPAGTFDECVWVLMTPALGANLPDPDTDRIVSQVHGIEVTAISQTSPFLNGQLNEIQPLNELDILFAGHRGRVLLFKEDLNQFEHLSTQILATGSLGKTSHLSTFYLLDGDPVISVSVPASTTSRTVIIDFTGTSDEESTTAYSLEFEVSEGGNALTLSPVGGETHKFTVTLPGGGHDLTATVTDPYGNMAGDDVSVTVNLCSGVSCEPWETCREVDGVCVGDDPCDPNPCAHGGTCDNGTGSAVCTCATGWTGADCATCPADTHYVDGEDCLADLCYGVDCGSYGSCNDPSTGVCACTGGYDPADDCASCLAGTQDNDSDGVCTADCASSGLTCDGSGHGSCSDTSGTALCECTDGWTGDECDTAPAPTITDLAIDLSSTVVCVCDNSGNLPYPVSFNSANATSWSATNEDLDNTGDEGTLTPSSGIITGSPTTFEFAATGGTSNMRITVEVTGPGGTASASIDFTCY